MKQKMLVKVTMNGDKSRSKALKVAVGLSGVESASLKGDDKSQIEVTGDGIDPVQLTCLLRKSVGYAELLSVAAVGDEKTKEKGPEPPVSSYYPPYHVYEVPYGYGGRYNDNSGCSIM